MTALIVAAGRGSRLHPYTDSIPKCLIPFAGRRLLEWQLAVLCEAGIEDIHIVRGYCGDTLEGLGATLWDNPDWASTNMVQSMLCARPLLESAESLLICYGDIIYEPRVLQVLLRNREQARVVIDRRWLDLWSLRSDDPLSDAESLKLDADGRIIDIGDKADDVAEIEGQYIGLMQFPSNTIAQLLDLIDNANSNDLEINGKPIATCYMTDLLQAYIDRGGDLLAAPVDGGWLEFDTTRDLDTYTALVQRGGLDRYFRIDAIR